MNDLSRPRELKTGTTGWKPDHDAMLRQAAERAMSFRRALDSRPQKPARSFAEMRKSFIAPLPEEGSDGRFVIEELAALAEPGLAAMTGPRFFGWVIGGSHPIGVAADWLTSAWGQNAGNHACDAGRRGVRGSGGRLAARSARSAARMRRSASSPARPSRTSPASPPRAAKCCAASAGTSRPTACSARRRSRVIIGEEAHSTVFSALQYLGLGDERVVRVADRRDGRACAPDAFRSRHEPGRSGPIIAIAQAGQINTGAFDPFTAHRADRASTANAWVHVDGAFGLWARATPDRAQLGAGLERGEFLGDRRPQMAADALRLRLRHRARRGGAPPRHADRRQLSAAVAGRRAQPVRTMCRSCRAARAASPTWAMIRAARPQGVARDGRAPLRASPAAWRRRCGRKPASRS